MKRSVLFLSVCILYLAFSPSYGQINFQEYFPLQLGYTYTFDDGAQCVFSTTRELDWVDLPAYQKVWVTNPHEDYSDGAVTDFFIAKSDSIFWVGHYWVHNNGNWEFHQITGPACIGMSNMTSGQEYVFHIVMENMNDGNTEEHDLGIIVESVGSITVPAGTFDDCIKWTEKLDGEVMAEWYLAKYVGMIEGGDLHVSDHHSMSAFQNSGFFDIHQYFPLDEGL